MLAVNLGGLAWIWSPYSGLRNNPVDYLLFWLAFGLGFGKMATKIIYAHLVHRPFPYHSGLMMPLFVGCLIINLPIVTGNIIPPIMGEVGERIFLLVWFIGASVGYLNWSFHVINSFCNYLGIHCFRLTDEQLAALRYPPRGKRLATASTTGSLQATPSAVGSMPGTVRTRKQQRL
jgi:ethanolaminephosphotransferase